MQAQSKGFTKVVCPSGGNAGLATAYSAMKLGLACHIVVMESTGKEVCENIESFGATVQACGKDHHVTVQKAKDIVANDSTAFFIHPFDDTILWSGHSTMIDEVAKELGPDVVPSLIVTCCGGGGLTCGIVEGVRNNKWQDRTRILVMETDCTASFNESVKAGGVVTNIGELDTLVTCLSASQTCEQLVGYFNESKPQILSRIVGVREAYQGCVQFANQHRFIVGLACGTVLSSIYNGRVDSILSGSESEQDRAYDKVNRNGESTVQDGPVVVIVCGGAELKLSDFEKLKQVFE